MILLNKDYKLILNQRKWFRSLQEANIEILEQTYNLKVTGNKRELIYKDNQLIGTNPILLNSAQATPTPFSFRFEPKIFIFV